MSSVKMDTEEDFNVAKRAKIISNTAAIYARYSSTNQREESIEAQIRACQDCAKRNELAISENWILCHRFSPESHESTT